MYSYSRWKLKNTGPRYTPLKREVRIHISKKTAFLGTAAVLIVATVTALLVYFLVLKDNGGDTKQVPAAIVANGMECSKIGMDILKRDGSVADAAIATMFCEGVTCPQSTGLGGGFVMTIYTKATRKVESMISRERAPAAATETMFNGMPEAASQVGGLSIAVPGELAGLWALHEKYGKLPWADLVEPTIKLCEQGHMMSNYLYGILSSRTERILNNPSLRSIFIDPTTNLTYQVGQRVKRLKLAETLNIIARDGAKALYDGELTDALLSDIQAAGGIITREDMKNYKPIWTDPITASLSEDDSATLYTTPAPSSGPVLTFILNLLRGYKLDYSALSFHRIVESFKYAYARRSEIGDPDFIDIGSLLSNLSDVAYADGIRLLINDLETSNDTAHYGANYTIEADHGTAHVSVIGSNGDAVAITGTINYILGSFVRSEKTGIILNDEMDDFALPDRSNVYGVKPSPANFIRPGKIPLSSMCPSIVVNKDGDVTMAVGGAGGTKITTAVALIIVRQMQLNESLLDAMFAKRLHHQLLPMHVEYEFGFDPNILKGLQERGHELKEVSPGSGFAAVTGISLQAGTTPEAFYDPRRGGSSLISWMDVRAEKKKVERPRG